MSPDVSCHFSPLKRPLEGQKWQPDQSGGGAAESHAASGGMNAITATTSPNTPPMTSVAMYAGRIRLP